jgi:hypothetical protein
MNKKRFLMEMEKVNTNIVLYKIFEKTQLNRLHIYIY